MSVSNVQSGVRATTETITQPEFASQLDQIARLQASLSASSYATQYIPNIALPLPPSTIDPTVFTINGEHPPVSVWAEPLDSIDTTGALGPRYSRRQRRLPGNSRDKRCIRREEQRTQKALDQMYKIEAFLNSIDNKVEFDWELEDGEDSTAPAAAAAAAAAAVIMTTTATPRVSYGLNDEQSRAMVVRLYDAAVIVAAASENTRRRLARMRVRRMSDIALPPIDSVDAVRKAREEGPGNKSRRNSVS